MANGAGAPLTLRSGIDGSTPADEKHKETAKQEDATSAKVVEEAAKPAYEIIRGIKADGRFKSRRRSEACERDTSCRGRKALQICQFWNLLEIFENIF